MPPSLPPSLCNLYFDREMFNNYSKGFTKVHVWLIITTLQVSLTLGCPMDLALFPLDTQTCHLTIASYGWAANDLVYLWKVSSPPWLDILPRNYHTSR